MATSNSNATEESGTTTETPTPPPPPEKKKPGKKDKEKPTPAPGPTPGPTPAKSNTSFEGLVMGRMVRFVVQPPEGPAGARLALVTRVINQKKGLIDCVVYPHQGDFHKQVDPGIQMGARNVAYHPEQDLLVPGTWHWPER